MAEEMKSGNGRKWLIGLVAAVVVTAGAAYAAKGTWFWHMAGNMTGHMAGNMAGQMGAGHMHGADGTGHDEVNMPGLRGANASDAESAELAVMFRNFNTLSRSVTELPDGIRTVTKSSDPVVMENLVSHVTGMIGRVENLDDPKIIIQSPTLDIFFVRGKGIKSDINVTEDGIVVTQTSDDPEVVKALQIHAGEVSAMAERGMQAVHEMMMKRAGN